MKKDLWLPRGFELLDGTKIRSRLDAGDKWQIFDTFGSKNILLASPDMVEKWDKFGFIDKSLFEEIIFGNKVFLSFGSHQEYTLAAIEGGRSPENKVDALAFAYALKESRKILKDVSFHDAIYVEQYSRLLPVWSPTSYTDDEVVLGIWLTGGVAISTKQFRRLTKLTGWMPVEDLAEIIMAAGFEVPLDMKLTVKKKSTFQTKNSTNIPAVEELTSRSDHPQEANSRVFKLPGRPQLEQFFNEHVIDIILNSEKYHTLGIDFPSSIVLYGPPGCGKTFAVERLVEFVDWPSYSINSNSVGSPYIHETSKKISEVFDQAIDNAPSIIVIDEMESFLSNRQSSGSSSLHHTEEVAEFLRRIPDAIANKVLVIGMTNLIDMIDPAILRRGRFDHVINVGMPSREEVESLVYSLLENLPKADDINLDNVLYTLTGRALSDSTFVIREASRLAAKSGKTQLDQQSIDIALNSLPKTQKSEKRRIGFV